MTGETIVQHLATAVVGGLQKMAVRNSAGQSKLWDRPSKATAVVLGHIKEVPFFENKDVLLLRFLMAYAQHAIRYVELSQRRCVANRW